MQIADRSLIAGNEYSRRMNRKSSISIRLAVLISLGYKILRILKSLRITMHVDDHFRNNGVSGAKQGKTYQKVMKKHV